MVDDILRSILQVLGVTITAGFWAFVLLFHVLSDWRSSEMGRHIMTFMGTCALILTWSLTGLVFQIPPTIRMAVGIALYGGLAWVVWWRIKILIKTQIQARGTPAEILNGREDP